MFLNPFTLSRTPDSTLPHQFLSCLVPSSSSSSAGFPNEGLVLEQHFSRRRRKRRWKGGGLRWHSSTPPPPREPSTAKGEREVSLISSTTTMRIKCGAQLKTPLSNGRTFPASFRSKSGAAVNSVGLKPFYCFCHLIAACVE